jgi:hypothetical protein
MAAFAMLMGAGTLLQAFGQIESARSEARAAKASSRSLDAQADEVLRRAEINVETLGLQGQELQGEQLSAIAKGGVDVSSGSALQVIEEGALNIRKEQARVRREAEFEARQLRIQAKSLRRAARKAGRAGAIGAIGTIATGAGSIAGKQDAKNS